MRLILKQWHVCLFTLLLLVSCSSQESKPKNILRLNMREDPQSLDPRRVGYVRDLTLMRQLFEGLMRLDVEEQIMPALAKSYDLSEDGCTYTFHLREAYWQNGEQITAHNFVDSWREMVDPTAATGRSHLFFIIKHGRSVYEHEEPIEAFGVSALDKHTLVVELETPTPYFLSLLTLPTFFPVNSSHDTLICSGPFLMEEWKTGFEMKLVKNPTYWDAEHVYLDGIHLSFIDDTNTETHLFEKGKLDWLGQPISNNISSEVIGKYREAGRLQSYMIDGTLWMIMNSEQAPFNEPLVRKAFAYAANRHDVIEHVLQGNQLAAFSPLPPSISLLDDSPFDDADCNKAQELLEAGLKAQGWTKETCPPIVLSYPRSERNNKLMQLLQQQWQQAFSIPIQLEGVELQVYRSRARLGDYQIGFGEWIADYHDPLSFLELFKWKEGVHKTRWHNPAYTALVSEAEQIHDPQQRSALLRQAEQILIEEMPVIPLYHYAFDYACDAHVTGVVLSPLGTTDFKSAKIR